MEDNSDISAIDKCPVLERNELHNGPEEYSIWRFQELWAFITV